MKARPVQNAAVVALLLAASLACTLPFGTPTPTFTPAPSSTPLPPGPTDTPTPAATAGTPSNVQVTGSVVLQGGACCVGGFAGGDVTIQATFEAVSPGGPVTEMRAAGLAAGGCRTEAELSQAAWEPFAPEKTFTFSGIPINWVGYYVSAQFRDAQGNLSEVVCDDISVEGMPPPPTP